ncbi:MAG: hypothetical protein FJW23_16015, partial [Acidimicrobiia bacterium]|nr:hypothetical protein [Acidimicrobiia bacterium]
MFAAESGAIFSAIRPDKVTDFELVLARVHEALARSSDPVRQQQAKGWKVFKAVEPGPNASVLYVFVMDPAVKGADYTISRILSEAFPDKVQELYKLYNTAFVGTQSLLNLSLVADYATRPVPAAPGATTPGAPAATPAGATPAVPSPAAPPPSTPPAATPPASTPPAATPP